MRKFCIPVILILLLFCFGANSQTFYLVKDINPGSATSLPSNLVKINTDIFFSANDGVHGQEFWKSNGKNEGTVLFKDINPGPGGSSPSGFIRANGFIFFKANDGNHGEELWKTDGTEAGTIMVKDIYPGSSGSSISTIINVNGKLFFAANDGTHGFELWKTDGTEAGTIMVKDINTGTLAIFPGNNSYPALLTNFNSTLYFSAMDANNGGGLWKSDGTEAGTVLIKTVTISDIKDVSGTLFFSGNGSSSLWKSDGTTNGTTMLKNTGPITSLVDVDGTAFFCTSGTGSSINVWKSDGTAVGTQLVKSISGANAANAGNLTNVDGRLYFTAPQPSGGTELWSSDGTDAGTKMVKDINPGTDGSNPMNLTNIDGLLYFTATHKTFGTELWRSNGTAEGTVMMQDIANPGDGSPAELTVVGSKLFITADDKVHGRELWTADLYSPIGGLPLTMLDFKGQLNGADVLLSWKTVAEHNTSRFEIERSSDGGPFIKAGSIQAAGNSTDTKFYSYVDRNIANSGATVDYYRLKMLDDDDKFTYSKTIVINLAVKKNSITLYPNPAEAGKNMTLFITAVTAEDISCAILDMNGRKLISKNMVLAAGNNSITLETSQLPSGLYMVVLNGDYTNSHMKFIKE